MVGGDRMLTAFLTTLMQMARILLFLVVGFALNRLHILPKGAGAGISRLDTMLFLPAMVIYTNMTEFRLADVGSYSQVVLLGCLLWAIIALISFPIAKKLANGNPLDRGVYLYGLCFPNTSAVGTPLALALLGTAGLFQYNLFILPFVIMTYAWGMGLFLEMERKSPLKRFLTNLLNPIFISMVIGLTLGALNGAAWMPALVTGLLSDLGACYVPVSLLLVGYTIAEYPIGEVFQRPRSYIFSLLRLLVFPLLALVLAKLFGASLFVATLVVLAFAGPSGMNVVVFPASYGQDCKTGASIVLLSCLGSVLTVPLLYAIVQQLFA